MIRWWIQIINKVLLGVGIFLLLLGSYFLLTGPKDVEEVVVEEKNLSLPKNSFEQPQSSYEAIFDQLLVLAYSSPKLEIPDLSRVLIYHGINQRPDASLESSPLYFSLMGEKVLHSVASGEPLYLTYRSKGRRGGEYAFSIDNSPTSLWIEAEPENDSEALVKVRLRNPDGDIISEPSSRATLTLSSREFMGWKGGKWKIEQWRVDGTLLARQRARWYGEDLFLKEHGGEEFAFTIGKERIDFGDEKDVYSRFIGSDDCLVWINGRWESAPLGEESREYPLLCMSNKADKVMTFTLWDSTGQQKVILNIIKATEVWSMKSLENDIRLVGARTRTQTIVEIRGERETLRPQDWLLLTPEGWQKLSTPEQIDDYVDRRVIGPLFIFEGVERKDGQQVIVGTIYNATRTAAEQVFFGSGPSLSTPVKLNLSLRKNRNREDMMTSPQDPELPNDIEERMKMNREMLQERIRVEAMHEDEL